MAVDSISKIEKRKMCFGEDENGYSFPKWLALLIGLQITWTRLKKSFKGIKNPFVYFYEEKLWFMAANIDQMESHTFNKKVEGKYDSTLKSLL